MVSALKEKCSLAYMSYAIIKIELKFCLQATE